MMNGRPNPAFEDNWVSTSNGGENKEVASYTTSAQSGKLFSPRDVVKVKKKVLKQFKKIHGIEIPIPIGVVSNLDTYNNYMDGTVVKFITTDDMYVEFLVNNDEITKMLLSAEDIYKVIKLWNSEKEDKKNEVQER